MSHLIGIVQDAMVAAVARNLGLLTVLVGVRSTGTPADGQYPQPWIHACWSTIRSYVKSTTSASTGASISGRAARAWPCGPSTMFVHSTSPPFWAS